MDKYKIAIIGAGPAGLSAAAHAAELGVSHILLESAPGVADTIRRFQKGKQVMAEPKGLPLRSALGFAAGLREHLLQRWQDELEQHQVNLRTGVAVAAISGQPGDFKITSATGEIIGAERVVLAIGVQGNIRKLDVPGDDLPAVQYQLADPDEFASETIIVVGGGDAGVENALALAKQNRVILVNRQEEFSQCKEANFDLLMTAIAQGIIETRVNTRVERVEAATGDNGSLIFVAQTPEGQEHIRCRRVIARLGATPPRKLLESFGVVFPGNEASALPPLSDQYESNVPGLYIIGALAGYPLIKQALNQGYEVVEYIEGRSVEPADEVLLKEKFAHFQGIESVAKGIQLIKQTVPLLASLTSLQLRELVLDSQLSAPEVGELIFKRNDYSNSFYSVIAGEVSIETENKEGAPTTYQITAGGFFGEMGLLSGRRRFGTAIAGRDCLLIETPRRAMLKLLNAADGVRRKLDEVALKRIILSYLDTNLSPGELDTLVHTAKLKQYAVGELLFSEGDEADGLYMIRSGSVTVSRFVAGNEVVLAYVAAGNYVGEMALVSNNPRSATVRAASPAEVVVLEADRVRAVLERNSSIRSKVGTRYLEHIHAEETNQHVENSGIIQFLMSQGVGEATDVLLIDYARCIRCNNCEIACAEVHDGISRLNREAGPTFQGIHVPASCRHCEHPHCMKDCPPDAIHRSVNGEVFIGDSCIGCGNCQRNCPYQVIQMSAKKGQRKHDCWHVLLGYGDEPNMHDAESNNHNMAVKCDMCKGIIGGAACVRSCPTGAALRVKPEEFLGFVRES